MTETAPPSDNVMADLRARALATTAGELGLDDGVEVVGALMELGFPGATATVVCFRTGDASMYLSSGGGFIGGIAREGIRLAALRMVDVAINSVSALSPVSTPAVPPVDHVQFIAITHHGLLAASVATAEASSGDSPLGAWFAAGQDVLTEIRLAHEAQGAAGADA